MRVSRRVGLLICAAAVAVWPTSTSIARATLETDAASPPSWAGDVADSRKLAGPVVARGTLVDPEGKPVVGEVVIFAWPNESYLEQMEVGGEFKLIPVARAVASDVGAFELRVDPRSPMQSVLSDTDVGALGNFHLVARSGDRKSPSVSFGAVVEPAEDGPRFIKPSDARPPEPGGRKHREATPLVFDGVLSLDGDERLSRVEAGVASSQYDKYPCSSTLEAEYAPVWVTVGETHTSPESTARFTYLAGSESTLGRAISSTGAAGTWEASGTTTKASNATIDFPPTPPLEARHHNTKFQYGRFRHYCNDGQWYSIEYEAKAIRFAGGAKSTEPASGPPGNYCVEQEAGSVFMREDTKALTWSTGVKTGASPIGINLSAQTGFTTTTRVKYDFSSAGQMCGDTTYPAQAKRVKAFSVK